MKKLKKPNPQDATRRHDVAPLRRRIEQLERTQRFHDKVIRALVKVLK